MGLFKTTYPAYLHSDIDYVECQADLLLQQYLCTFSVPPDVFIRAGGRAGVYAPSIRYVSVTIWRVERRSPSPVYL